eukprot:TRINITY_DN23216_c0_g1_i5.p1 TRINITY_DN23216_c0_g1~~TRINITY_DN23216_c0_g1_i5.p1  ORF type:complete len:171 (-),score=15.44 TRINITY_DN23216_c0_g1_i5:169-681(-)
MVNCSIPRDGELLIAGAGDSDLSAEMSAAGWTATSIDFSHVIIEKMRERHPHLSFLRMDARAMDFQSGRFAAVLDKGLLDCLGDVIEIRRYFDEVHRVVRKPGGVVMVISMKPVEETHLSGRWICEPRKELMGPLFADVSEFQPAEPQRGTEGTIPYYLSTCRALARDEL